MINAIIFSLINLVLWFFVIRFFILVYKALKKYLLLSDKREEKEFVKRNLGEILKEYRIKNNMTQEFVSEAIGVSRQTVSKWETAQSEPSTSNLIAIAKLYKVPAEEILRQIKADN